MNDRPVIIVTGGSRGMGAWIVRWLAKAGAAVAFTARTATDLANIEEEIGAKGGKCLAVAADASDPEACSTVVEKTLEKFNAIDALVNNAGVLSPIARVADCDVEQFRQNIMVNLLGPFYFIRAAVDALRKSRGRVINVSSGAAVNPMATWSAYCAAKAGLTHFTRVFDAEEPDITSVSVRPGVVDTDMQALIRREGPKTMPPKMSEYFSGLKERGALEHPRIPARSIAWLALNAPPELGGKFVEYDDPRIAGPALSLFGDTL
jgi:NAD(P)-dependent dehydrogenase (short-subunit alcohol dehydrogenase family)